MKVYVEGQLQTRKWTDQQGQDRYTTEVVLQKFRGELQMLDARGQGGEGGGGSIGYDRGGGRGSDFGQLGRKLWRSRRRRPKRGERSGGGSGFPRDLDDEIPF